MKLDYHDRTAGCAQTYNMQVLNVSAGSVALSAVMYWQALGANGGSSSIALIMQARPLRQADLLRHSADAWVAPVRCACGTLLLWPGVAPCNHDAGGACCAGRMHCGEHLHLAEARSLRSLHRRTGRTQSKRVQQISVASVAGSVEHFTYLLTNTGGSQLCSMRCRLDLDVFHYLSMRCGLSWMLAGEGAHQASTKH